MNYNIFLRIQIFIPFDLRIQRLTSFDPNGSFPESRRKASSPQNRTCSFRRYETQSCDIKWPSRMGSIVWVSHEYEINWIIQYLRQFWEDSTKLLIIGSAISSSWEMQSADWSFDCIVESSEVNWLYTSAQKHVYTYVSFTVLTRKMAEMTK